ncbi:MAG: ATP-dependent Clp protease ATP-binding subunit [Candidatus Kerfeldbacteria bacterium]|nr:ATP-dependent Clp protease ATP-binding subunit [Candidatus Kerfeldbacteria bacterium]
MPDILSKFTTHYQKILSSARASASLGGHQQIEIADLLMALAQEQGSMAAEILAKHGLAPRALQTKLGLTEVGEPAAEPSLNSLGENELLELLQHELAPTARRAVERSVLAAWRHQHHYVGTEHLLYALVVSEETEVRAMWARLGIELKTLKLNTSSVLKSTSKFPDLTESFTTLEEKEEPTKVTTTPALDFFCTDLTSAEVQVKIDPVIGRDREIQRLINILARRTKNNPLLLGDPGVGKTAIVEGLAKRIHEGRVPDFLQDKRILSLDLGLTVAGTMYRGEFESRLKQIMEELKIHPEVILFIDELHTIVGTGAAPGSLDVANLLKPALAKGLIRCIGATTQEEYKKSIESDAALERRFQVVQVAEPSPEETIAVLQGLRDRYESFHHVRIADEAVEAAVQLSERYLPEKFLPDKAIDLIDEAASHLKTSTQPSTALRHERELEARLKQLQEAKELAIREENFSLATAHKEEEKKVAAEAAKLRRGRGTSSQIILGTVGRQQIAEVVAQITGVPLTELLASERTKLANLEAILTTHVVGQAEAVAAVAKAVRRARLGLGNPERPMGSFIFLGPSGVGKTELAKVIAEEVFEDPEALVRLDMSEFSEGFNISKLIGAPAGYVGYKDANKLTDLVRRKPHAVVLFDEIEKAHPDVFNLLLQILEDGHLTDAAGKQVNFKNALILMTSNLGLQELTTQADLGFSPESKTQLQRFLSQYEQTKERLLVEVNKFFRPEFLNRLDGVIVFRPLGEADLERIVKLQVQELNIRFLAQKVNLTIALGRGATRAVARQTFSPEQGARGIRRFLQEQVEDPLTQRLLEGKLKPPAKVTIKVKDDKVTLE